MRSYKTILVIIYFFLATVFITYPLIYHLRDYTFGFGDEALITWIINWDIHSMVHDPWHIYNAPFYFPYKNALAYSDTFFTSAFIAFLPIMIFKEPMIAYNVNVIFSLMSLGFFTYLLVNYLTDDSYAGVVSGTLLAYSSFTLQRLPQLQVISIQWIPLCLLFFFIYIRKKSFRYLFISNLFFIMQIFNSILPGYFVAFSLGLIVTYYFFVNKKALQPLFNRKLLMLLIIDIVLLFLLTKPYFQVAKEFHYVRDIRETINFANRPEYILYPNDNTRLAPLLNLFYKNDTSRLTFDGYFGFALLILSIMVLVYNIIKWRKTKNAYLHIFLLIGVSAFILSLGPALQWGGKVIKLPFIIPLPYALLYYIIPGFKGIRNSGRWDMMAVFALSVAIGIFISIVWKRLRYGVKVMIAILICVLVLAEFNFPRSYYKIETLSEFPLVYQYLSKLPKSSAIIELPYYNWNMSPYGILENRRAYYETLYYRNRVNGGSGFSPQAWQNRTIDFIFNFPDARTINYLKSIKVTHIVMHKAEYDNMKSINYRVMDKKVRYWDELQNQLKQYPEIKLVKQVESDFLYEIVYEQR
jgi:hypothetical protein